MPPPGGIGVGYGGFADVNGGLDLQPDGQSKSGSSIDGPGGVVTSVRTEAEGVAPAGPTVPVRFTVNGELVVLTLDPRESLLDVLRERLGLTGTKKGCDQGQCGACTVHLDGRRVVSCLTPAVQVDRQAVVTIEGIAAPDGTLHPLQQAFIDHDGLQCGYCTPGQVMSGVACIAEGHATSDDEIREYMSGNLCRCGAYAGIVAAVHETASRAASRAEN
jgi:xanthine dehydrogenase YagT iron-sulfur-binding subunit